MEWIKFDGNQGLINDYKLTRPLDTSICEVVSNQKVELPFFISKTNLVSTVSKEFLEENKKKWEYAKKDIIYKKTRTLTKILDEYNYINKNIDFLSIDVEGHDFEVLLGLDLKKYRPFVISIEVYDLDLSNPQKNKIINYLNENNYSLKYYAIMSAFFIDNSLRY